MKFLVAFVAAVLPIAAASSCLAERPNIVLILADDLGHEILPVYGNTVAKTPRLDKLAAGGMLFQNCFAQPICTPSRVQLMTGRYGHRNYQGFGHMPSTEITFGNVLRKAGYRTAIAGKWQLSGGSKQEEKPNAIQNVKQAGFDEHCL